MARLSKHGTELLRVEKEVDITDPESSVSWRKTTRAYFSNGDVLQKQDAMFKPTTYQPHGERHTWGWKVFGKIKSDRTPQQAVQNILAAISKGESRYRVVSNAMPVVIISQKRILAACESGDNRGFCKACGAEAYNVEPDARGYRCETCNQPEVYGAEEMLMETAI